MWRDTLNQNRRYPAYNTPPLERSQSTSSSNDICRTPDGPPDITARDLSPEELKRNYSFDNVWDQKTQPLVPMDEMVGLGRHRRSKNAPVEWQVEHLEKTNHFYPYASELASLADGPSPAAVALYNSKWSRSNSTTSTNSGQGSQESFFGLSACMVRSLSRTEHLAASDGSGGGLVSRIHPARASHSKSSSLSQMLINANSPAPALRRAPTSLIARGCGKKTEQACEFYEDGNTDSAFVTDDEDEGDWRDISAPASKATDRHIQEQQLAHNRLQKRSQTLHIENIIPENRRDSKLRRSNTVKPAPPRPVLRRGESNDAKKPKQVHIKPAAALPTRKVTVKRIKPAPAKTNPDAIVIERLTSSDESERVYMRTSAISIQQPSEPVAQIEMNHENTHLTIERQAKPQPQRDTSKNDDAEFLESDESTLLAHINANATINIVVAESNRTHDTTTMEDGLAELPIRSSRGRSTTMVLVPKPIPAI